MRSEEISTKDRGSQAASSEYSKLAIQRMVVVRVTSAVEFDDKQGEEPSPNETDKRD